MKLSTLTKLFLIIFTASYSHFATAQAQWDGATNSSGVIHRTGNVYIGTSGTSGEKLNVKGNMLFTGNTNYDVKGDVTTGYMCIYPGGGSNNGPFIEMAGKTNTTQPGSISIGTYGAGKVLFSKYNPTTSTWTTQAVITDDGKFAIGNVNYSSNDYSLFVERGILAEQVKVAIKSTNDWSDYVFDAGYELMPLKLLEKYINENKHLPDMPSAEEVVSDGVNIAKMDASLLQKIEELTLYIIEQDKKLNALQQKIDNLELQK